jgi:hypothetical protein
MMVYGPYEFVKREREREIENLGKVKDQDG